MKPLIAAALAAVALTTALAQDTDSRGEITGRCFYTLKNTWAGPYKVCLAPVSARTCNQVGESDENSSPVWSEGACPVEGSVGTCTREKDATTYYDGDASGIEMGCGFQSGTWKTAP
jgi:hypothetical protein